MEYVETFRNIDEATEKCRALNEIEDRYLVIRHGRLFTLYRGAQVRKTPQREVKKRLDNDELVVVVKKLIELRAKKIIFRECSRILGENKSNLYFYYSKWKKGEIEGLDIKYDPVIHG